VCDAFLAVVLGHLPGGRGKRPAQGAALAAVQSAPRRALRLAGAAAALRAPLTRPLAASEQAALERRLAPARRALSAEEQATAWAEGQAMTRAQAIADALTGLRRSAESTPRSTE